MPLIPRLVALLVVLIVIHAVYAVVQSGTPLHVRDPATDLSELPLELSDWVCPEPSQRDSQAEDIAGADASLERMYTNRNEQAAVAVYVALWKTYPGYAFPHVPPVCYSSSGYEILDISEVAPRNGDGSTATALLMHAQLDDRPAYVLYWYQLDQNTMTDVKQIGEDRWSYARRGSWPPMVKVMLDIRSVDQQQAGRLLIELGEQVLKWTSSKL